MIGQIISHYRIIEKLTATLTVCDCLPFTSAMNDIPLKDQEA